MKKILLSLILTTFFLNGFGTTYTITNVGFTFSPATLSITQNDHVTFTLASIHDAVEVSQATWNANDITPITGFSIPFGGGTLLGSQLTVGTHYYVCENHASMGMKGIITVLAPSAVPETKAQEDILIYPCPAKNNITVQMNVNTSNPVEIKLYNLQGRLLDVLLPRSAFSGVLLRTFSLSKITGPGVYFLQVTSGELSSYQKIIVM